MLNITISKRSAFMIVLAVLLVVPAIAFANDVFDDVGDTSVHADGIGFMKSSGVSVGCDATNYCPSDNVSRAQMGTFLYRLSGNDPATPPSVIAVSAATATSADTATSAGDSDTVGGLASNEFARIASTEVTADVDDWDGAEVEDTATVTAPRRGVLLITYSPNFAKDNNETGTGVGFYNLGVRIDGSLAGEIAWESIDFDSADGHVYEAASIQRTVTVDAGTYDVSGYISRNGGTSATSLAFIFSRTLTVIFIPFDGTGSTPASVSVPASTGGLATPQP